MFRVDYYIWYIAFLILVAVFMMGKGNRMLFRVGYYLYTNTRFGPWYFQRSLRSAHLKHATGHTNTSVLHYKDAETALNILPVAFSLDNYAYIIWRPGGSACTLVDPADAESVLEHVAKHSLTPVSALITHKHWDHAGGLKDLVQQYPSLEIFAPPEVEIPHRNLNCIGRAANLQVHLLNDLQKFTVPLTNVPPLSMTAYQTPGHTTGHMCFQLHSTSTQSDYSSILFSGDCLFVGGVGRFFEGSARMNLESLEKLLTHLPHSTVVFPGHEYALDNLKFAQNLENKSQLSGDAQESEVEKKFQWCVEQRMKYPDLRPCIPSSLESELLYNPFLRVAAACSLEELNELLKMWKSAIMNVDGTPDYRKAISKGRDELKAKRISTLKLLRDLKNKS